MSLSNKQFCYWLQGFFEISEEDLEAEKQIIVISNKLKMIGEEHGDFTGWLKEVIEFILQQGASEDKIKFFNNTIKTKLNNIFHHVIDNSYETDLDKKTLQDIHDGKLA